MKIFAAQFDAVAGPRIDRSFKLILSVDETQSKSLFDLVSGTQKGTEFLFLAFETNKERKEVDHAIAV